MPRESYIERRSVKILEDAGYLTMKAGKNGWPDRLVLFRLLPAFVSHRPTQHAWIEFKQPGAPLTKAQIRRIPKLKERGEVVLIIDRPEVVLSLIQSWQAAGL